MQYTIELSDEQHAAILQETQRRNATSSAVFEPETVDVENGINVEPKQFTPSEVVQELCGQHLQLFVIARTQELASSISNALVSAHPSVAQDVRSKLGV